MSSRTPVNINSYTVYDNVDESDDQFNVLMSASLVMLGDDMLVDDALTGSGQLRVRADATIDGLLLDDTATFVNTQVVTETGADDRTVAIGQSASDAATIRNIAGATWDLTADANVTGAGSSQFVNLGLLDAKSADEVINGDSYVGESTIGVDFFDRGGAIDVQQGELRFTGAIERFINGAITGGGEFIGDDVVFANTSISVEAVDFVQAQIVGDVDVSSPTFTGDDVGLGAGGALTLSNTTARLVDITGVGTIDFTGTDSLVGQNAEAVGFNDLYLKGGVTLVNDGDLTFPRGLSRARTAGQ